MRFVSQTADVNMSNVKKLQVTTKIITMRRKIMVVTNIYVFASVKAGWDKKFSLAKSSWYFSHDLFDA